jgi:hypothetical protein
VGNNRGEVRDSSITHGGAVLPARVDLGDAKVEVDGIVGSETIEIKTATDDVTETVRAPRAW